MKHYYSYHSPDGEENLPVVVSQEPAATDEKTVELRHAQPDQVELAE